MFPGADELERLNRTMGPQPFVQGPAAERAFHDLVVTIGHLRRDTDTFEIPGMHGQGAWAQAWEIYKSLKARPPLQADPEVRARPSPVTAMRPNGAGS
jgi:hypothetical protein